MKVAVFGASGFVGRNMVEAFKKRREMEIVASDIRKEKIPKEVEFVKANILNLNEVRKAVKNSDVVIHLAASPLTASLEDPRLNMQVNITGTLNILDSARKYGVDKVIFSSASSIYGDVKYNPVDENHPCKPKTPYAVAKYACEHYLRVYQEIYGVNYFIFRFFNVYGSWQYPESGALVPNVFKKIVENKKIDIYGDGSATRDFVYVDDIIDFFIKVIKNDLKNEIVNLGSGKATTIKQIVDLCGKIVGVEPIINYLPPRSGEISNFYADATKLRKIFGTTPAVKLEDGLRRTFNWLKEYL